MDRRDKLKSLFPDSNLRGRIRMKLKLHGIGEDIFDDDDDAVKSSLLTLLEPADSAERETFSKRMKSSEDASGRWQCCSETRKDMRFDLEECDMRKWVAGSLVHTDSISEVMKSLGGFPTRYYVRHEEIMVSEIIRNRLQDSQGKNLSGALRKFAIVGSPGVGKSVFMVLLAFYLARCLSQGVLLLRKLKTDETLKCVFLSQDSYSEFKVRNVKDIMRIREGVRGKCPNLWYFVDGFTQVDVNAAYVELLPYNVLATSSQFRVKSDDPTKLVVLPAWQFNDLEDFANKTKMLEVGGRAKDLYYFSGGSLREFSRQEQDLKDQVAHIVNAVGQGSGALNLLGRYGGASEGQLDNVRRHYVENPKDLRHYSSPLHWTLMVDSVYVLKELVARCSLQEFENVYNLTKGFGGPFHGWAFEQYLHKLAVSDGFAIQARKHESASDFGEKYEIIGGAAVCKGTNESECYDYLSKWSSDVKSKYWYPEYGQFPCIDCISKCQKITADGKGGRKTQDILAYIHITISDNHSLDVKRLKKLDKIFEIGHRERVFIAILPRKVAQDKTFKLTGTSIDEGIPLYVAYFDGERLGC